MTDHKPLSTRHERFVQESLKDGNATRAHVRAGCSPHNAQSSASRLMAQPPVEAAVATGRQRPARSMEVTVERRIGVDPGTAGRARRAGAVELNLRNHSKPEQRLTLAPGRPAARLTAKDRARRTAGCAGCESALNHSKQEQRRLGRAFDAARAALAEAQTAPRAADLNLAPIANHSIRR